MRHHPTIVAGLLLPIATSAWGMHKCSRHEGKSFGIGGGISFNAGLELGKNAVPQGSAINIDKQGQPMTDIQAVTAHM